MSDVEQITKEPEEKVEKIKHYQKYRSYYERACAQMT